MHHKTNFCYSTSLFKVKYQDYLPFVFLTAWQYSSHSIAFVQVANTVTLRIKSRHFRKHCHCDLWNIACFLMMLCFVTFKATVGQTERHISARLRNIIYMKISIFLKGPIFNLQRKSVPEAHFVRPLTSASSLVSNNVMKTKQNKKQLLYLISYRENSLLDTERHEQWLD